MTVFHELAASGDVARLQKEILKLTAQYDANTPKQKHESSPLDEKDALGITPLQYAAQHNHDVVIELLVRSGANVNKLTKNASGRMISALHYALQGNHVKATKKLIELNANVHILFKNGFSPFHIAAEMGSSEMIELLLAQTDLDPNAPSVSKDKWTPAHLIAMNGQIASAKELSKWGMDIEAKDKDGRTPLYFAYILGHIEVAKILLAQGAGSLTHYPINLEIVFTIMGGEKLACLLTKNQRDELDVGGDPISSLRLLLFYLSRFFLEQQVETRIAKKILNILKSKYSANDNATKLLAEKIQQGESVLLGTGDEEHFVLAQLHREGDKIRLYLYDRGLLIGDENPKVKNKFFCIRSLTFNNDINKIHTILELLKEAKNCEESMALRLLDQIQSEAGQKYLFLDEPTQKPFKIQKCHSANYHVALSHILIKEIGIKEGLMIYKSFTLYFRKSVVADFIARATVDKKFKKSLKAATTDIFATKEKSLSVMKHRIT